jgi:hypothetical protein
MWPRDCSCDILTKNKATFCLCPKSLPEAKLSIYGLIKLAEDISKPPSIDSILGFLVLLWKSVMKRHKLSKEKIQNVQFEEERNTRLYLVKWTQSCHMMFF